MIYTNNTITNTALTNQCPLIGGTAVYNARAIINSYFPTIEFDSDSTCQLSGFRGEQIDKIFFNKISTGISVNPNPTVNILNVINDKSYTYQAIDLTGKLMLNGKIESNNYAINFANIENGFYFIRLIDYDNTYIVFKVIVNK